MAFGLVQAEKTILFADNSDDFRKPVSAVLAREGYNFADRVATDGKEALQTAHALHGPIDLLLSDIDMPEMSGIELAIHFNCIRPETRILLISGYSTTPVLADGWQFLPKPFRGEVIRARVREFLAEPPPIERHLRGLGDIFQMGERLRHETEKTRLGLIRTDLQLCFTFADIAETQYDLGYQEHTERMLTIAEKRYSDMLRFFSREKSLSADVAKELQLTFEQLRNRLATIRERTRPA